LESAELAEEWNEEEKIPVKKDVPAQKTASANKGKESEGA
jgi:hypothetical protein